MGQAHEAPFPHYWVGDILCLFPTLGNLRASDSLLDLVKHLGHCETIEALGKVSNSSWGEALLNIEGQSEFVLLELLGFLGEICELHLHLVLELVSIDEIPSLETLRVVGSLVRKAITVTFSPASSLQQLEPRQMNLKNIPHIKN
jgi:hypothetical protein